MPGLVEIRTNPTAPPPPVEPPTQLDDYIQHFRRRVLVDALLEATAAYWNRRADSWENALPRPGDYPGQATPAEHEAHRARVEQIARNCRIKATLLTESGLDDQAEAALQLVLAHTPQTIDGGAEWE